MLGATNTFRNRLLLIALPLAAGGYVRKTYFLEKLCLAARRERDREER